MPRDVGCVPMDEPLAFLLTWTTYGTWLPGDNRGWVDKPGREREPNAWLRSIAEVRMTEGSFITDTAQRRIVEETIREHCHIRNWHLHAVSARSNHVHVVVTAAGRNPDDVMSQFKAWCTRRLKEHDQSHGVGDVELRLNWWTQRGSRRWLNDEASLNAAIVYVAEGQGEPTPSADEVGKQIQA
jgi:REP element-mobilizing transposase RayT